MIDLKKIKLDLLDVAKKHSISLFLLFGSQVSGKIHPKSDVDFGFLAEKKLKPNEIAKIQFILSERLKIKDLEVIDLKDASPLLLRNIAQSSILLYQKETELFERFKIYGIKIYMESKKLLKIRESSLNKFLEKI
ncbi:MAG: nucleotidyltransferase domain-containing protein [Patescibacteria group bacterium]